MSPVAMLQAAAVFSEGKVRKNFQDVTDAFTSMRESLKLIEQTTNDPHSRELARSALAKAGAV